MEAGTDVLIWKTRLFLLLDFNRFPRTRKLFSIMIYLCNILLNAYSLGIIGINKVGLCQAQLVFPS